MSEKKLKPCPFHNCLTCGCYDTLYMRDKDWNTRPIEDALHARIAELEEENDRLQDGWFRDETFCPDGGLRPKVSDLLNRIAELEADSVQIQYICEDELPEGISDEVFSAMYACSTVDFVRVYPYITIDGHKRFLVELPEATDADN